MRKLGIALVLVAGCSDNGLPTGSTTDQSVARDLSVPPDLTSTVTSSPDLSSMMSMQDMTYVYLDADGTNCGNKTCAVGEQCCVSVSGGSASSTCAATCPDGGVTVMCDGPEDCSGHNPCCVTISRVNGMTMTSNVSCTQARTDCVPDFNIAQMGGMTRLCHVDADCLDNAPGATLRACCTAMMQGQKTNFCFNPVYASLSGGAVTCP